VQVLLFAHHHGSANRRDSQAHRDGDSTRENAMSIEIFQSRGRHRDVAITTCTHRLFEESPHNLKVEPKLIPQNQIQLLQPVAALKSPSAVL
jgi:hypothetical protein